jgi:UDP-N-acetylglucosamine 2-epimerase (non-hydrolysing)
LHWVLQRPVPPEIDALLNEIGLQGQESTPGGEAKLILVTAHRRENFGVPLENICQALRAIAARYGNLVQIIYPVHPNPHVSGVVQERLAGVSNITLLPPLDYASMIHLANRSYMIVTDSGGLQEEAPSLGKPVLVLRKVTERTETIASGTASVVGVEAEAIVSGIAGLLDDTAAYRAMISSENPYGDGKASERIINALQNFGRDAPARAQASQP